MAAVSANSYVASVLPVWVLLQPRDYINGVQLFVGLILLFGSVLTATLFSGAAPEIVAPAINISMASRPLLTPPVPIMGTFGQARRAS